VLDDFSFFSLQESSPPHPPSLKMGSPFLSFEKTVSHLILQIPFYGIDPPPFSRLIPYISSSLRKALFLPLCLFLFVKTVLRNLTRCSRGAFPPLKFAELVPRRVFRFRVDTQRYVLFHLNLFSILPLHRKSFSCKKRPLRQVKDFL